LLVFKRTLNQRVLGSSPSASTTFPNIFNGLLQLVSKTKSPVVI